MFISLHRCSCLSHTYTHTQSTLVFSSFTFCVDRRSGCGTAMTVFSSLLLLLSFSLLFSFSSILSTDGRLVRSHPFTHKESPRFISIRKKEEKRRRRTAVTAVQLDERTVLSTANLYSIYDRATYIPRRSTSICSCRTMDESWRFYLIDRLIMNEPQHVEMNQRNTPVDFCTVIRQTKQPDN